MIYEILEKLENAIKDEPIAKTVTIGDIFEVDLNKQTLFPLAHIILNSATHNGNVITFNMSILFMDLEFDNRTDVLNTQFMLATRVIERLNRGDIYDDGFELSGTPSYEPFHEKFENMLAGWSVTFDVNVKNSMTVC